MRQKTSDMASAILAGGKNSRMNGRNKAFLKIEGMPIIQRTIGLLKEIFTEVILVTNSTNDYSLFAEEVIMAKDIIKDAGPLGGIHAALSCTSKKAVFFVACDMPFLHNDIILRLLDCFCKIKPDAVIPRIGVSLEPLCAIYRKSLGDKLQSYLKNNVDYSVKRFLKTTNVYYLDLEDSSLNRIFFKNLNTAEDFKGIIKQNGAKIKGLV